MRNLNVDLNVLATRLMLEEASSNGTCESRAIWSQLKLVARLAGVKLIVQQVRIESELDYDRVLMLPKCEEALESIYSAIAALDEQISALEYKRSQKWPESSDSISEALEALLGELRGSAHSLGLKKSSELPEPAVRTISAALIKNYLLPILKSHLSNLTYDDRIWEITHNCLEGKTTE